jgi:hypothetical protein
MSDAYRFYLLKERIRMAMVFSKVAIGEDANGLVYEIVSKEEAVEEAMRIVNGIYYELSKSYTTGRVLETLIHRYNPELNEKKFFEDYLELVNEEENARFADEVYWQEIEIAGAEAEQILNEREEKKKRFTVIDGGKKDE